MHPPIPSSSLRCLLPCLALLLLSGVGQADGNGNPPPANWLVRRTPPPAYQVSTANLSFLRNAPPRIAQPDEVATPVRHVRDEENDGEVPTMRVYRRPSPPNGWQTPMRPSLKSAAAYRQSSLPASHPIPPVRIAPAQPARKPLANARVPKQSVENEDLQDARMEVLNRDLDDDGLSASSKGSNASSIDQEEIKLKGQTKNLVKWLRNRLRKRLQQVANLETEMETERNLVRQLNDTIANQALERHNQILLKLNNQKRLTHFRKVVHVPDENMSKVEEEKAKLSEQLARITRTYETLAQVHKDLRNKLHSSGLSHWLEARGKEYMPETTVGVLSKSAEILDPVTHGIEKAYEFDNQIVEEVESVVPGIARRSIVSKVLADVAMVMPLIPLFILWFRLIQALDSLSIVHIVFYIAVSLGAELFVVILLSVYLGEEALHACQTANESFFSGGVLFNFALLLGALCAQILICVLYTNGSELAQLTCCFIIMHHFWRHVFVPAMVGHGITTTTVANVIYIFVLAFVVHQKKEALHWHTSYDELFAKAWEYAAQWSKETAQAMGNVFRESNSRVEVKRMEDFDSVLSSLVSSDSEVTSPSVSRRDSFDERVVRVDGHARANVVDAPTQMRYGRWTGATAWPIRQHNAARMQSWREEQAHDVVGVSRSRRFARFATQTTEARTYRSANMQ